MSRLNNKKDPKKLKAPSSKKEEDFNTGSHSPSSVRKVGAGYDDTGKGNNLQVPGSADKNAPRKKKTNGKQ
jgi:hypothetical protein